MSLTISPIPTRDIVRPTTHIAADRLGLRLGIDLHLVSETFQHTGSFKFRAAYHVAAHVPAAHIIVASSGNFGQALAAACARLGKRATVVMPETSAAVKIAAVRDWGAAVDLIDVTRKSRAARVAELGAAHPEAYLASAYDDPLVIAGNATLGEELAAWVHDDDLVVVPIGGGGLCAGVVTGLRARGVRCGVVGAEPLLGNDAARSLRAGEIVANTQEPATLADGARTVSLGRHPWQILSVELKHIVEVPEAELVTAVQRLFLDANLKAEPTGALSVAALLTERERFAGRRVWCIISGGNVDPAVYAELLANPAR